MTRFAAICDFYKTGLAALVCVLGLPSFSMAAWLGYKNNTQAVIVVQTSVNVNGRIMNGKAHTLYPGEVAWDNIAAAGMRQVAVYDAKANNRLVTAENINIQNQDVFLSAQMVAQPQIPNRPPVPPVLKLMAIKAPVAPGVVPEKPKQNPNPPVPPKGPLPPTVIPKTPEPPKGKTPPPPAETPKTPPPKDAPKSPPPPAETPKSKSG